MSSLSDLATVVDHWVEHLCRRGHSPGIAAAIVEGNEVVLSTAHGLSDVRGSVAMTTETPMPIASLTKPMVATALLMMEADGLLSIHDPVSRHLGRDFEHPITIRQLLTHTAGLSQAGPHRMDGAERLQAAPERPEFVRQPDTMTIYSNYGYHLAGQVLEAVDGASVADVLKTRIFDPLGMDDSALRDHFDGFGYLHRNAVGIRPEALPDMTQSTFSAAAGVVSTLSDMTRWLRAWTSDESPLPPSLRRRALNTHWFQPQTSLRWGLGWELDLFENRDLASHAGHFPGYHHLQMLDPELGQAVVVLTNAVDTPVVRWVDAVSSVFNLARQTEGEPMESELALRVAGVYRSVWDRFVIAPVGSRIATMNFDDDDPFSGVNELEPISENELLVVDGTADSPVGETISFTFRDDGTPDVVLYGPHQVEFEGPLGSI